MEFDIETGGRSYGYIGKAENIYKMSKTEDHSSYRKETIIQISEARASENRAQEAPTMLRKDVNLEELGLSEVRVSSLISIGCH